jgi:PTS system mannose-specific IIA component
MDEESDKVKNNKKIGGVIITHGQFAKELLAAAEIIVGPIPYIKAVSIGWHDDVQTAKAEIKRAIKQVSQENGVLLLTDMFGGTPTNIAAMFLQTGVVELITGVNLPMVIKLASQNENAGTLLEFAGQVETQGKNGIYRAGDLMSPAAKLK